MKLFEIIMETEHKGTYAGVRFDDNTKRAISKYIKDNDIPNPVSADKLHTTLLYSRKHLPNYKPLGQLKRALVGHPTEFDVWESKGKLRDEATTRCLVLEFKCPNLVERHKHLMDEHQATYDFPEYKTHITLSYDIGDLDIDDLPDIKKTLDSITIVEEYSEELDLQWAKNKGGKKSE